MDLEDFVSDLVHLLEERKVHVKVDNAGDSITVTIFRDGTHKIGTRFCCGDFYIDIEDIAIGVFDHNCYDVRKVILDMKEGSREYLIDGNKFYIYDDGGSITIELGV